MVSCKSSEIIRRYVRCHVHMHYIEKTQFSVQFVIWDMCGYVLRLVHWCIQICMYFIVSILQEAPPLRLVKYTEKQVLDKIEALDGELYCEVLKLTRQKDEQGEQEKIQEEKRAQGRAEAKRNEEVRKSKRKKVSKNIQEKDKQSEEEG